MKYIPDNKGLFEVSAEKLNNETNKYEKTIQPIAYNQIGNGMNSELELSIAKRFILYHSSQTSFLVLTTNPRQVRSYF